MHNLKKDNVLQIPHTKTRSTDSVTKCTAHSMRKQTPKGSATPVAGKLPVDIIIAQEKALEQQEIFVGSIMPYQEVAIVSETAQKITKVAFKDGSYVSQGAVLYTPQ